MNEILHDRPIWDGVRINNGSKLCVMGGQSRAGQGTRGRGGVRRAASLVPGSAVG